MKKQISFLVITGLIFSFLFNASTTFAAEKIQSGFNPNKLIDDKVFSNSKTMSVADIQKFLEGKNSVLANTSNSFVSKLNEPVSNKAMRELLEDPNTTSTTPRTAAELIYDAARSSGINPQVILVTLNKEQSLITGRQTATEEQLQRALNFSMGFGCPDSQPCGEIYKGFYFQLFGGVDAENNRYLGAAKSLMKSFSTPGGRGPYFNGAIAKVGDAISLPNTLGGYEGVQAQQSIVLSNSATAALYRYTPHVFNGNYNFWRFFKEWFGSPNSGTDTSSSSSNLIKTSSSSDVYIIENNRRYKLLPFVAKLKNIKISKAEKVSKKVMDGYVNAGLYNVTDNSLIKVDGKYYVFISNKRRLITEAQIKTMGLNIKNAVTTKPDEANQYTLGPDFVLIEIPPVTPAPSPTPTPAPTPTPSGNLSEGAVVKTASAQDVYLVSGGKLKLFTYATFVQFDAIKTLQVVDPSVLAKYPKDGLVLPKPGTLVKAFGSQTVYFYEDGKKKPMDGEIFRNRGFSFTNVFELTNEVIDALPLGSFPLPAPETYFKDKKGQLYLYRDGKKLAISAFVAAQKKITPDFTFGEDGIKDIPNGTPILPKEGTVFKSDKKADVYIINASLAFPMTAAAFTARGITPEQVNILPQAEVDSYPKGSLLTK